MSQKIKHTPGPWVREIQSDGKIHIVSDEHGLIATVSDRQDAPTAIGNSRLFADAPEMLEALRDAVNKIDQLCSTVNTLSPGKVRSIDFTESIKAVLTRIEGRE